jgi:hypothetical protein
VKSEEPVVAGRVASRAPAVAAPIALATENFRLQASDYNPVIVDLDGILPTAAVKDVVDSANRAGSSCSPHRMRWPPSAGRAATPPLIGIRRASPPPRMPALTGNTRARPSSSQAGIVAAAAPADGLGRKALEGVTVGGATSVAPPTPVAPHNGLDSQTNENLVETREVSELRPWHLPIRATSRIALAGDFGSASSNGAVDDAE